MAHLIRNSFFIAVATLASTSANALFIDIQPFQICDDGGGNCAQTGFFEAETDMIWAQAGIDVNFLGILQINETDYLDVTVGSNPIVAQETIDVMNAGQAINDSDVTLAINMFFVDTLDLSASFYGLGCGAVIFSGNCAGEVGIFIAGGIFAVNRIDTIAHEIGHVLEIYHNLNDVNFGANASLQGGTADPANLMARGSQRMVPGSINDITPDGLGLSQLRDSQIASAQGSRFVQVSEPPALLLLLTGLLALGIRKRKIA